MVAGTPAAVAAKRATSTIPIVTANAADPVDLGLVASLARPGGNVTGNSGLSTELNTKRLEVLKDAVPKLSQVALLRGPIGESFGIMQVKELRPAAVALKLKLERSRLNSTPRIRERVSNRKTETGRDYDGQHSPFLRRKKANRRACHKTPVAGDLRPEGVRG